MNINEVTITMVARNSVGHILFGLAKRIQSNDPCYAEAAALSWALEIAILESFTDIIVEGDAKVCIDAVSVTPDKAPWKIQTLMANVFILVVNFNMCVFSWVHRNANSMAHNLAKFASLHPYVFSCNNSDVPPSVHEAWLRDLNSLSC